MDEKWISWSLSSGGFYPLSPPNQVKKAVISVYYCKKIQMCSLPNQERDITPPFLLYVQEVLSIYRVSILIKIGQDLLDKQYAPLWFKALQKNNESWNENIKVSRIN